MENASQQPPKRRRRWIWIIGGITLAALLIIVLLPLGISGAIQWWLKKSGAEDVLIEDVDFNLFTGQLAIKALKAGSPGQPPLRLPELRLDLAWLPLLERRSDIESFVIDGAEITIEQLPAGGTRISGIEFGTAAPPTPPPAAEPGAPWGIGLRSLRISNSRLRLLGPDYEATLRIDSLALTGLDSRRPTEAATLAFAGAIEDAPLDIQARLTPFAGEPHITAQLRLADLPLQPFEALAAGQAPGLAGRVSADLALELQRQPERLAFTQRGSIDLHAFALARADLTAGNAHLGWDGTVQAQLPGAGGPLALTLDGALEAAALDLALAEAGLELHNDAIRWQGSLELERNEAALALTAEGTLGAGPLALAQADTTLRGASLAWQGAVELRQTGGADTPAALGLRVDGSLDSGALELALADGGMELHNGAVRWEGVIELDRDGAELGVSADGGLRSGPLAVSSKQAGLQVRNEQATWQGRIAMQQGTAAEAPGPLALTADGSLDAGPLDLATAGLDLRNESLAWRGRVDLQREPAAAPALTAEGSLDGGRLDLTLAEAGIDVRYRGLDWQGRIEQGRDPALPFTAAGSLAVRELKVHEDARDLDLFAAEGLSLRGLSAQATESIGIETLTLEQPQALHRAEETDQAARTLFRAERITVQSLQLAELRDVDIAGVALDGMHTFLRRNADGRWHLLQDGPVAAAPTAPPVAAEQPSPPAAAPALRIGALTIGEGSQIQFVDQGVAPPFAVQLQLSAARLGTLDSRQPEQPSPLHLAGQFSKYSSLAVDGTVQPFASPIALDLKGKITGFDLPPLSPYVAAQTGYNLASGHLDADIALTIRQGKLDGSNALALANLKMTPSDPDTVAKWNKQLTMPLDSALSMLRDKHNNIALTIPVAGDLAAPELDFQDAINQALSSAMKSAAVGYLKHVLQPYGTMISIAQMAGKAVTAVRLDPIGYAPGTAEVQGEEAVNYLQRVGALLQERPELRIKLCGIASAADRAALQQAAQPPAGEKRPGTAPAAPPVIADEVLLDLARQRAEGLKDLLVSERGIAPERLFVCHPEIDADEAAAPRVELLI